MKSPVCGPPLRKRSAKRHFTVHGKTYSGLTYSPQFALGIMCQDEADQISLHRRLTSDLAGREIKVLVI